MIVVGDRVAYAQWRWNDLREGTVRAIWPCFEEERGLDGCTIYSVRDDAVYMFTYVHSIGGVLLPRIEWHAPPKMCGRCDITLPGDGAAPCFNCGAVDPRDAIIVAPNMRREPCGY